MQIPGSGILKGLAVTARNMIGSYFEPERLITQQYPEEKPKLPERARVFPFLIYDGSDPETGIRCTSCKICEKECPPQCIYIVQDRDQNGKPIKRPKIFNIDISVCMSCGICVEVCPFDSIRMDTEFELSSFDRFSSLILDKSRLLKPNSYYHQIHPTEAAQTDERIEAERRKKQAASAAKNTPSKPTTPSQPSTPPQTPNSIQTERPPASTPAATS
ncbi:MAG: NADH-quinone oxidoreductase subunit I [Chthoniobacterales bacterium]|nr:NADH-quinone oxidoreductase subunit I [Chthoniobacterales bacterium]